MVISGEIQAIGSATCTGVRGAADCWPVVYPDCGDCGGRDETLLVCTSYEPVLCLFRVCFAEEAEHKRNVRLDH